MNTLANRLALLVALLASCASLAPHDELRPTTAQTRDLPLEQLALLYDDTIVTPSARTVDFHGQAFVPRIRRVEKSGPSGDLRAHVASTAVVLGLHEDVTLTLEVPYVARRLRPAGVASTVRAEGPGDTRVVGKFRFYQDTRLGETSEGALLLGLELPTGVDDLEDAGAALPARLQPGSGSLDTLVGAAFTRVDGRWLVNAALVAGLASEGNGYRFGNRLNADVGVQFRAIPGEYERYDQTTWNLVAELNGAWAERDRTAGAPVADSGGAKLFFTPGIQVILNEWALVEGAVQLPVATNLNGTQLEEDYVALLGVRIRF